MSSFVLGFLFLYCVCFLPARWGVIKRKDTLLFLVSFHFPGSGEFLSFLTFVGTELSCQTMVATVTSGTLLSMNLLTTGTGYSSLHFTQLLVGCPRPENLRNDTLTKSSDKVLLQLMFDILTYLCMNKVFISSPSLRATDFLLLHVKTVLTHLYSLHICEAFTLRQTLQHDLPPVASIPKRWQAPPRILCGNSFWWEVQKPMLWCLNTTAPFTHGQSRFPKANCSVCN